jgi:radical SAM protein (TIGR04043 family)
MEKLTSTSYLEILLRLKTELLTHGIIVSTKLLEALEKSGKPLNLGRKGGAGPAGGRYFEFPNGSIVNTPLWLEENPMCNLILTKINDDQSIELKTRSNEIPPISLKIIENPLFYSETNAEGIRLKQLALMHGNETLATTIYQRCKYWRSNQQCKFCAIELSLENGSTIEEKSPSQVIDVIKAAKKENPHFASHITLTSGTISSNDKGILKYLPVIEAIKNFDPTIKIHFQIEPLIDLSFYDLAKKSGADTVGIHIEILDDRIRKKICPGKGNYSKTDFFNNWDYALKVFGKNQVDTFILTGFDQDLPEFRINLEKIIQHGVIPLLTPARSITGVKYSIPTTSSELYYDLLLFSAKLCLKWNVNPLQNLGGCVRCGGCSTIIDAYNLVKLLENQS